MMDSDTTPATAPAKRITVARLQKENAIQAAAHAADAKLMRESIVTLQLAIEDRNWRRIGNAYQANGLSLDSIKAASEDLRGWIAGGGILKRIIELRGTYIYGDGFSLTGIEGNAQEAIDNENNIAKLFSVGALQEINRAHGSDGMVVFLVHKQTHEIIRLPLEQLDEPFVDADDVERIWYIRQTYTRTTAAKPEGEKIDRFIPTTTCPPREAKKKSVDVGGGSTVPIEQRYTALVWKVNGQTGWPLGIPDLFASLQWAEKYTGYLKNQDRFAEALATIAWEYKAATTDQAKKMAATVAVQGTAGTTVATPGMEAKPMSGASDVSFINGEPLAAQAAAAGEVPVEAVLGKSMVTASGSLDPDFVRVILARRESVKTFIRSLGKLLGAPKLEAIFYDIESETPFREAQMMVAAAGTGLFKGDEIRVPLAEKLRLEIEPGSKVPDGYMIPNNSDSLKAAADAVPAPTPAAPGDPGGSGGSNNGQGNDALGVGKLSNGDNTARDNGESGTKK